ncbi:PREDICTED: tetraketide alpha-pyrone reductase 1-like [Tarenaya hassleriana]|uniref:tetraketide alpha-pyrone reductase 1-like n=1 Tax=Tarenaya hassleriana TaxID=28532 RepID=UPI00053C97FD|nr:PREDICTED: tetraketide alpha-pyrone reductase 1-like [Tarenaya hassleriana]
MEGGGKVVCVTGASGYIASWLVKLLLSRGYAVRGTVRDLRDPRKTEHLLALEGAKEGLKLFQADLLDEGSFDEAVHGCDGVFHTASPVFITANDPQAELIDPAVKGTINVLKSCAKASSSVKKVVVTSSTAAVLVREPKPGPGDTVDETFFSDPAVCVEQNQWYILSKTLAEEAASRFAEENGIETIVINPGLVIGPLLQPTLNFSVEVVLELAKGNNPWNSRFYRFVDVRDVADAHIKAFEIPSANGRYIVDSSDPVAVDHVEKVFQEFYPDLRIVGKNEEEEVYSASFKMCVDRVKSLGIEFTPVDVSLRDTVQSLLEKGFL